LTAESRHRTEKLLSVDGQGLKRLVEASLHWLRYHQPGINALNVFPVPDGDTGTNMLLTMQGAWHEVEHSPEENVGKVAQVAQRADGRAQFRRNPFALARFRVPLTAGPTRRDLAHAMREASDTAYKGVLRPVEGTILTVSRAVADAAEMARREDDDLLFILERLVAAAKEAVANTPNLLPVLKQAGVVDSGGQGLTVILEGMLRYLRGESLESDQVAEAASDLKEKVPPDAAIDAGDVAQGYTYDVQCIIKGHNMEGRGGRESTNFVDPGGGR
jgi:dihydroxyacetone kinase-like predicted kinase